MACYDIRVTPYGKRGVSLIFLCLIFTIIGVERDLEEEERKMKQEKVSIRIVVGMVTPGAVLLSSFLPAVFGVILSAESIGKVSGVMVVLLILIPSLMNASVDVLNDYFDYISGNDTSENIAYEGDGPLAYYRIEDPRPAFWIGVGFMAFAAVMGIYVIWKTGPMLLAIGLAGGLIAATYSGKGFATSYIPIGELLAGFTLGGMIPLAVFAGLTGKLEPLVLYKSIPWMLLVMQFMLENNTCDIERDEAAGRRTMPIIIGKKKAENLAIVLTGIWFVQMFHVIIVWYGKGTWILTAALLLVSGSIKKMLACPRNQENKVAATEALTKTAIGVAAGYLLAVVWHITIK